MHGANDFLGTLAVVLCVGAVTTVLFNRLKQPVILGYLLAGLIVGPHVPIPLVADLHIVQTLSELGVILLMFSLGLEFRLAKLFRVGPIAGFLAVFEVALMLWLGYVAARAFGFSTRESLYTGALVSISSTTIIAKAFEEKNVEGPLRELVFAVLIVEDLVAIVLLATLPALATPSGLGAGEVASTLGRLFAFLVALLVLGMLVVPRAMRRIVGLKRREMTVIASVGLCFGIAAIASRFGYSVALGAFLAGSLCAESGEEHTIAELVQPVRDVFGAIFFIAVGMLIDPALVVRHWRAVVVLSLVVVVGKIVGVGIGAILTGNGVRRSVRAGMSLAQIGEFSFIIASLGVSSGATREFFYPVAVSVSAITTLLTPWLIGASTPVARLVDSKLPRPLQTFVALYGTWLERLRAPSADRLRGRMRRLVRLMLLDAVALGILAVGALAGGERLARRVEDRLGVDQSVAHMLVIVIAVVCATPFLIGLVRMARRLALGIATEALPAASPGRVDLAAAPRGALVVGLQLAILLVVGAPLVALTQPLSNSFHGALLLVGIALVLGVALWRSAANLEGHVRAGAQVVLEALAAQGRPASTASEHDVALAILPGLGSPVPVAVHAASAAVGKSLAELNLRGSTGATVLAIRRGADDVLVPAGQEIVREGDILAVVGPREAIDAARSLFEGPPPPTPRVPAPAAG